MKKWLATTLALSAASTLSARTLSGNEFALRYSEASTDSERAQILQEAGQNLHFFRYLQIMEITEEKDEAGRQRFTIVAFEPSSLMDVAFKVNQPVSVSKLLEEPRSKPGDAIAVTGRIAGADAMANTITLDPVIVKHKDRLSPAAGKEMLYELKPDSTCYSFTDGPRPINVSYRDRDLLRRRKEILSGQGKQAWFDFLEAELKARKEARERGETGPENR